MNKKNIAVVLELLPIISVVFLVIRFLIKVEAGPIVTIADICMITAFFGFVFFLIGRKLAKEEKIVRILGICDLLATVGVIGFYILVFIAIGSGV